MSHTVTTVTKTFDFEGIYFIETYSDIKSICRGGRFPAFVFSLCQHL